MPWQTTLPQTDLHLSSHHVCLQDMFSFGVLLWELVTLQKPWHGLNNYEIMFRVGVKGDRLPLPADCPLEVVAITKCCWRVKPQHRPRPQDVMAILKELLASLPT